MATLIGIGASSLVLSQAVSSCGSEDSTSCTPGAAQSCTGSPGACAGFQVCNEEGTGFGACDCSSGSGGTAGVGGSAGGANMSGAGGMGMPAIPPLTNQVGVPCGQDSDCPTDGNISLVCLRSDQDEPFSDDTFVGGPQGGYCSYPCTRGGGECETLVDGNSGCGLLDANDNGYCLGLCQPGAGAPGQLIKCGDDRPQACVQAGQNTGLGLCLPVCQSDEGCGDRFCDPGGLGLCVDEAPAGGGVGAPCSVDSEGADCASGICLEYRDDDDELVGSFCSANCTLGEFDAGCGFTLGSTADREAACLARRFPTGGVGDLGFCIELCDVDEDCTQAGDGWVCDPFSGEVEAELGRAGGCIPAALLDGEVPDAAAPEQPTEDAG